MSLKPNRPASLPPSKQQYRPGYPSFDPYAKNDSNNNKTLQANFLNRPTVIRPSTNQGKKKPPPRPAPPKHALVRKNAIKRTSSSVKSSTPDLLADLQDIFGAPKTKSNSSPTSSRPSFKKSRAPQPQWQKKVNEGSLIDFNAPSPIHQSSSTPSFTSRANKTLLDEDLPNVFTSSPSSNSLQDLLSTKSKKNESDPFDNVFNSYRTVTTSQQSIFGNNLHSERKSSFQNDPFNDFLTKSTDIMPDPFKCSITFHDAATHDPFESTFCSTAKAISNKEDLFSSTYQNPFGANKTTVTATSCTKNGLLNNVSSSSVKWESTTENATKDQWSFDHFASPPEPQHPPPPPPPEVCFQKWCVALYDFEAQTKEELSFLVGDIIFVEEETNGDWWKGQLNGKSGLFPANYVEEIAADSTMNNSSSPLTSDQTHPPNQLSPQLDMNCYATALYTFEAEQDGDLSFKEGDVIQVLYRINQDWLYGKFKNKEGQFPANFVKKLPTEEKEKKVEVLANYAFRGEKGDELTFQEGDWIIVTEVNSDWSKGYLKKDPSCIVGYFPTAFTSPVKS